MRKELVLSTPRAQSPSRVLVRIVLVRIVPLLTLSLMPSRILPVSVALRRPVDHFFQNSRVWSALLSPPAHVRGPENDAPGIVCVRGTARTACTTSAPGGARPRAGVHHLASFIKHAGVLESELAQLESHARTQPTPRDFCELAPLHRHDTQPVPLPPHLKIMAMDEWTRF